MSFNPRKIWQCAAMAVSLSMFAGAKPSAGPRPGGDPDDRDPQVRRVLLIRLELRAQLTRARPACCEADRSGTSHHLHSSER